MKIKFYQRILILPILLMLGSALVPWVASGQDFVISETKLTNTETESTGDEFGFGVAIDGSSLVIGAPRADDGASNSGSAHLFSYSDGNDFPQTKLTEIDDPQTDDRFGNSVDISGEALVIGAYLDDINARNAGSAFVWTTKEQIRLTGDPEAGNEFGYAVAISGNVVVVGAHKDDDKGRYAGSVYVFRNNGSTWTQEAKLLAGDAVGGERFGSSVAIDGDTIVVGAIYGGEGDSTSGSVYVFRNNESTWTQEAKLLVEPQGESDKFGYSVAIEGDIIIVGAPYHNYGEDVSGAAYVFRRNAATWFLEAKLTDSGLSADARFGNSVALSGNTAVVGVYKADALDVDNNLLVDAGSAYVFRFDGSGWVEKAILTASDAAAGDEFGIAVAISGGLVVVGAHKDDAVDTDDNVMLDAGSAYIFTLAPENHPPVADAGADKQIEEGSQVTLDGYGSDPDGDALSYSWTQTGGSPVELGITNEETLTFTAPPWPGEDLILTFQLEVKDDSEAASTDEVEITVLPSTNSITEINSVLGSDHHRPWGIDKDIYTFKGTEGKQVTVTLKAKTDGKNNHGDRATLQLRDNIKGIGFQRTDSGRMPNQISATLPATGEYQVIVAGKPRSFRGKRFLGEYTLTVEGATGSVEKGAGSPVVHKNSECPAKPHKQQSIWNWLSDRFRH